MLTMTQRLSVIALIFMVVFFKISETAGKPGPEHVNSVADTLRYLQDLENRHAQYARPRSNSADKTDGVSVKALIFILEHLDRTHARTPRFGKRGQTDYLTKEYLNEYLKYLDTNSELEANPQES